MQNFYDKVKFFKLYRAIFQLAGREIEANLETASSDLLDLYLFLVQKLKVIQDELHLRVSKDPFKNKKEMALAFAEADKAWGEATKGLSDKTEAACFQLMNFECQLDDLEDRCYEEMEKRFEDAN